MCLAFLTLTILAMWPYIVNTKTNYNNHILFITIPPPNPSSPFHTLEHARKCFTKCACARNHRSISQYVKIMAECTKCFGYCSVILIGILTISVVGIATKGMFHLFYLWSSRSYNFCWNSRTFDAYLARVYYLLNCHLTFCVHVSTVLENRFISPLL